MGLPYLTVHRANTVTCQLGKKTSDTEDVYMIYRDMLAPAFFL